MTKQKAAGAAPQDNKKTDDLEAVVSILKRHGVLFAAYRGLDKRPAVQPVRFLFEQDGALFFAASKSSAYYGALSLDPFIQLLAYDPDEDAALRISGKVCFSEDEELISRCFSGNEALSRECGGSSRAAIAYFLTDAAAVLTVFGSVQREFELGRPSALIGITMKKNTELRDRLLKLIERRAQESGAPCGDGFIRRLSDGALLYFAETAKGLWPRMDIRPIESSLLYETYDEREKFTGLAKKLIGNREIKSPEDLTYWLSAETLAALYEKRTD